MNIMEQRIWDYLDGTCTEQDRILTGFLIETNPAYRSLYEECKSFDMDISSLELDEPSMGFDRNVMDRIQMEPVPGSIKSLIDNRIIYGITAFFLLTISVLLGILFYQMDWSQPVNFDLPEFQMKVIDTSEYTNSTLINIFLFADIIIAMYLFDGFLRKRLNSKNI